MNVKETYNKTFALAVEKLEERCKQSGVGEFVKTNVSAIWYRDGSFDRVSYDPDCCVDKLPLCPVLEVYYESSEEGTTYGLNTEEDVTDYITHSHKYL